MDFYSPRTVARAEAREVEIVATREAARAVLRDAIARIEAIPYLDDAGPGIFAGHDYEDVMAFLREAGTPMTEAEKHEIFEDALEREDAECPV